MLPLQGVRVVEQASDEFALIGRTLAELGAEVIRIEPAERTAPRGDATAAAVSSWLAAAGKRRLVLELKNPADRAALRKLLAFADIYVRTHDDTSADITRDILSQARSTNTTLVAISIADFDESVSPRWQATDEVLQAVTGCLARSGLKGRAPLLPPPGIALQCAAIQALYVVLLAYMNRLNMGIGDHIRLSKLDLVAQCLDPAYGIAGTASANQPSHLTTRARPDIPQQYPIIRCQDGWVRICLLSKRQWAGMFEWMGRPKEFSSPSFMELHKRLASRRLVQCIAELFSGYTRAELETIGHRYGIPLAALREPLEFACSTHIRERNAFVTAEIAPGVVSLIPNGLLTIDGCRAGCNHPKAETISWSSTRDDAVPRPRNFHPDARPPPLRGIRVLDLGSIVVGAEQGRLLADYGAEVIKIESSAFSDGSRQTPDGSRMSRSFAAGNRNKQSFAVDLRADEGRELFLQLVDRSDIVLSNFRPGVLQSLGLSDATLLSRNPRLIIGHSSAFGSTGPWSNRRGYGPIIRAAAGLTSAWRYPDDPTAFGDTATVYPDHVSARLLIAGVLSLLVRKMLTGTGGTVEISQAELVANLFSDAVAVEPSRTAPGCSGTFHARDAPSGVFPCAGDDQWCVVKVSNNAQWRALCVAMGRRDLLEQPGLRSSAGRVVEHEFLETCLIDWLSSRTPEDAMRSLQDAGVPAGAMLRGADLPSFSQFKASALYKSFEQRGLAEPFLVDNLHVRSEHLPLPPLKSAPLIGEHTTSIARELLQLSPSTVADLISRGIIEACEAGEEQGHGYA